MESVWQKIALPKFPQLEKDIHTNVLIIGGGIAGILTAYMLHQNGVKYALVEKGEICSGVTQNTTAKITFQHGLIYGRILKSSGMEKAQKYLKANMAAFDKYARMCRNIDCDYEIKDNYVYSVNNRKILEEETDALRKIGYHAELCDNISIPVKTSGAVRFESQAQFNPLKFIASVASNLNIYENTFVREMTGSTAVTDRGKIYAERVIVTTHFPFINKHGGYFLKLYQHRSYVLALENIANVKGMYVDENHTGLSFRSYGKLLLLGGGGHRTGKEGGGWDELRSFADRYYPHAREKYFWAAQDCMSLDGIPYIGQYSKGSSKLYVASGFNKWGMTGAMTAALVLSNMILGGSNEYADVFDPSRSILKPQLIVNGFESAKNLLTISEKRCPHLGCALKWNAAEHSWDCPCHGSRFSESGEVLDNPANGNLSHAKTGQ
ncbi:MAG: FAD-dependent oxidoreductase [Lachnospiraceae bacterium]|nr:FAD-dependent oxidoreductase [Lachnospiraceae bacterium]